MLKFIFVNTADAKLYKLKDILLVVCEINILADLDKKMK